MHVAIDGSPLSDSPNSPLSLHLLEWLHQLHNAGLELTLLAPPGEIPPLPSDIELSTLERANSGLGRLRFEQRVLPRAASDHDADLLLVGEGHAPLASPIPIVTISALRRQARLPGLWGTIASAAGKAGSGGASLRLSPSDVRSDFATSSYPAFVAPAFEAKTAHEEGDYVLYFGADLHDLAFILSAWTYVDGSLGDTYPLTFLGVESELTAEIERLAAALDVTESIRIESKVPYLELPQLYQNAAACLGTSFAADGQVLRWAMATGTPLVGLKTPQFERIVGKAAYLVPPADSRTLGAALLTVLIQDRVSGPLRDEGLKVAAGYSNLHIGEEVANILREVASRERGA